MSNEPLSITMEQLIERTGLKRGMIYKLIREGKLKTLEIKKRSRLFSFKHVKEVLGLKD